MIKLRPIPKKMRVASKCNDTAAISNIENSSPYKRVPPSPGVCGLRTRVTVVVVLNINSYCDGGYWTEVDTPRAHRRTMLSEKKSFYTCTVPC